MIEVTQEDREAARVFGWPESEQGPIAQAFARHRIAARNAALDDAAATITDLRARIAELEADKAQWVEIERMQLGIQGEG